MQTVFIKGFKPQLIKQMAILMSIYYLMNPLQQQINTMLHELSHGLELPNYVMSHEINSNVISETHMNHVHNKPDLGHNHSLIDFIDTILKASNETSNSDDSQLTEIKWDKHFTTFNLRLPPYFEITLAKHNFMPKELHEQGHFKKLDQPPQYFLG